MATRTTTSRTAPTRPSENTGTRADTGTKADTGVKAVLPEMRKPLFAGLGAADFAVAKLLELPGSYSAEIKKLSGRVNGLPDQVKELPTSVGDTLKSLPTQVQSGLTELSGLANKIYGDFASRGEMRVSSIRRNPSTQQAVSQTKSAVSRTKAAQTSTRKAATAAGKAVGSNVSQAGTTA
ncbi:MAG: hypothetical protein ACQSGP_00420 [Frankia sp.]